MEIKVRNKKWDLDYFFKKRKEVLPLWPTGKEVNLDEAIEYHRSLPEHKNFHKVVKRLHEEGRTVVWPRAGTPILEQEIELNRTLVEEAGLPLIPVTPDSFCRLGQFEKAQRGLEESIRTGVPKLNGFPTVIHGVKNTRKVVEATEAALSQRLTNIGGVQLMAEIAFAAGMTAALTDAFMTFGWYQKNETLAECIEHYQYIWRLMGYYAEKGVILSTDFDSISSGGVFPPSVAIVSVILEILMAAEQGVKSLIPGVIQFGHLSQDVAHARVLQKLAREYLDKFGYKDVEIPGMYGGSLPLFPYPQDMGWAFGFLTYHAMVAALSELEMVYLRSIEEAVAIPTKEAHAVSYRAAKWIFDVARQQKIEWYPEEVKTEQRIIELEARAIIDKILELGEGDVAVGSEIAVQQGIIDVPLMPNKNLKDKVIGVRDIKGACRYADFGNLPIPEECKEYHRQKITERERVEGRKMDYKVMIGDFWAFSKGKIIGG